jgi:antitoxin (DNA-binding transcriptional repressor) of toxin-antitoxin stability system
MKKLGAFLIKTHLSQILKEIEMNGESIAITRHGRIVAIISPPPKQKSSVELAIESIKKNRRGVTLGKKLSLKKLIEEGRR